MAGNRKGGLAAAKTNKARHGEDFYRRIGVKGGKASRNGGFFGNRELARRAGAIGGRISRRRPKAKKNFTAPKNTMVSDADQMMRDPYEDLESAPKVITK